MGLTMRERRAVTVVKARAYAHAVSRIRPFFAR
jgi:hypothetical protein